MSRKQLPANPDSCLPAIPAMEEVCALLARCRSASQALQVREQAELFESAARIKQLAAAILDACEAKLRAERRIGEFLGPPARGGRGKTVSLPDSIDRQLASQFRKVAAVPERAFEDALATARKRGRPITRAEVLRVARGPEPTGKTKPLRVPFPARETSQIEAWVRKRLGAAMDPAEWVRGEVLQLTRADPTKPMGPWHEVAPNEFERLEHELTVLQIRAKREGWPDQLLEDLRHMSEMSKHALIYLGVA